MITIFSGPPGSGKSHLIRDLIGVRHQHGKTDPLLRTDRDDKHLDGRDKLLRYLAYLHLSQHRELYSDGGWLDSIIRDSFFDHTTRVSVSHRRILERLAYSARVVEVLCLPQFEVAWRGAQLAGEQRGQPVDTAQYNCLFELYRRELEQQRLPRVPYDYIKQNPAQVYDLIQALRPQPNQGPGLGNWLPERVTLLVGERPNVSDGSRYLGPFCALEQTGCSGWLNEQLDAAGVLEKDLYWVNSHGADGRPTDASFVHRLKPKRIIALGKVAGQWCKDHDLYPFEPVDHPQHHKRFHHHERYPLIEALGVRS